MQSIMSFILKRFYFSFIVLLILNKFNASEIKQPKTLILGLTRSMTTTPTPKTTYNPAKRLSSMMDVNEPQKEVRDGYIISLNLGTPPQLIQVYLDTGSDLTWVPCGNLSFNCIDCDDYRNNKLTASFSPFRSSSSFRASCLSPFCIDIHSSDNSFDPCTIAGCSLSTLIKSTCYRPCPSFAYTYGDGMVVGTLTRDVLRVHGINNSIRDIPKFCFGCVNATYREPIGIAGFGKGPLSLPSQLGFLQKGFSHCFLPFKFANNPNISSPLIVGNNPMITLHFMDNVSLILPQGNSFYAMSAPNNSSIAKCLLFQSMEDSDYGPAGIFGSFQQQNMEVVYDLEKGRIGFQIADCAISAVSHGLHKGITIFCIKKLK